MKTLLFCNQIPERVHSFEMLLCALAQEFKAKGDSLSIVWAGEPVSELDRELTDAGADWRVIEGWSEEDGRVRPWRFCLPAFRLLRLERPDVVAINFGNELPTLVTIFLNRLLNRQAGTKWVWQQHQQISAPTPLTRRISRIRLLALAVDHFVALYDGGEKSLLSRGIPESHISVIYNGIRDFSRRKKRGWLRREIGVPDQAVLAVSVGSLIRRKRVEFQLEALARLPDRADIVLLVLGDGSERRGLETLARGLGIAERVRFLGARDDVTDVLFESDMLLHSASAEASAYAILESMVVGIPAVATDAGAASEQIEHGRSGFVLARDDMNGFTDCVARLAADAELRREMGRRARQRWEAHYQELTCARKYHALYRRLAGATDQAEAVMKPVTRTVDEVFGRLHKPGQIGKTVAEMDLAVARRMRVARL